jgi:uncharacterized protein YbcV (DUF1398 family)
MDTNTINECKSRSLANTITFKDVVKRLEAAGVERYIADLVGLNIYYYGTADEVYALALAFKPGDVAQEFNAAAVKEAIIDSQQQRIDYRTFLQRVVAAGCSHYEVFITGKKVIYFGRDGSQHTELFPQAKP